MRIQYIIMSLVLATGTLFAGCTSPSAGYGAFQAPVTTPMNAPAGSESMNVTAPAVTSVSGIVITPVTPGPDVLIDLVAKKMAFNTSKITVPAGAHVIIRFQNQEPPGSSQVTGIPHNFAVYTSSNVTTKIFSGEIITGGENITYTFTAPAVPGTYYFRCDVYPPVMNGQFIVT